MSYLKSMLLLMLSIFLTNSPLWALNPGDDDFQIPPKNYVYKGGGGSSGPNGTSFEWAEFEPISKHFPGPSSILRNGLDSITAKQLEFTKITRQRNSETGEIQEEEISALEALILELADYPAMGELRSKALALVNDKNFDPIRLAKYHKGGSLADGESALSKIQKSYPGVFNEDGSINESHSHKQSMARESSNQTEGVCPSVQAPFIKDTDPCSFTQIWAKDTAKSLFSELKREMKTKKQTGVTYVYMNETGSNAISATWKFNGKSYEFQRAFISDLACYPGLSYDLFAFPQPLMELKGQL